jgi:hypothetical protein
VLLGRRPDAPLDESHARASEHESTVIAEKRRLAAAGGELLTSAFRFLGAMLPAVSGSAATSAEELRLRERLRACAEPGSNGDLELRVTLEPGTLDGLAATLARILAQGR